MVKLHGDYLDARILNTQDELDRYPTDIESLLDRIFDEYGLIVAGWSGEWDTALRNGLLRAPNRRYPLYWAARGEMTPLGQDIVRARAGRIIEIEDADKFFVRLANTVDALTAAHRAHPESLAVTLALAKKYARDDKFALEWTDLLRDELAKIRTFVTGSDWPTASLDAESLNALVAEIVGRTEALRRICMIGERWGTVAAQNSIERALAALNFNSVPMSGFTHLIALRNLPASLCFEWALAGALYRDDYQAANRLMKIPVRTSDNSDPKSAAETYPMSLLESPNEWKFLKGYEKMKLPQSAFLEDLFKSDANDIVIDESEILPLFDNTEFLISMEYAHHRIGSNPGWFWTPLGQFIFRGRGSLDQRLEFIDGLSDGSPILANGLLGGTSKSAKATVEAVREHLRKVGGQLFW